jgi:hypothetical protein
MRNLKQIRQKYWDMRKTLDRWSRINSENKEYRHYVYGFLDCLAWILEKNKEVRICEKK